MKLLKSVLVAGSVLMMSTAHAQTSPSAVLSQQTPAQDTASTSLPHASRSYRAPQSPQSLRQADECVGPASYCTIFFGGS